MAEHVAGLRLNMQVFERALKALLHDGLGHPRSAISSNEWLGHVAGMRWDVQALDLECSSLRMSAWGTPRSAISSSETLRRR